MITALDEEDALQRVEGGHIVADLILVNLVGKSVDDLLKVGRRIREHARYDGNTPLVVMPEKYGKDIEGTDVNVGNNDWITYLEDPDYSKSHNEKGIDSYFFPAILLNRLRRVRSQPTCLHPAWRARDPL